MSHLLWSCLSSGELIHFPHVVKLDLRETLAASPACCSSCKSECFLWIHAEFMVVSDIVHAHSNPGCC